MIKLNTWKKMGLMVFFALSSCNASDSYLDKITIYANHVVTNINLQKTQENFSQTIGRYCSGKKTEIILRNKYDIKSISVRSGRFLDALIFKMADEKIYYCGGSGGSLCEIRFDPDEFIIKIKGASGDCIDRIQFCTNKRIYDMLGGSGGYPFSVKLMRLFEIEKRFTEEVHRGFYNAFAALGDTVSNHQNREHHTNEFLRRADPLGNPGFKPLEYFCGALDTRFKRLDEKDADTLNQLAQLRDTFWARNGERETQVRDIWGGINEAREQIQQKDSAIQELKNSVKELQAQVTALTAENQRLITIVNGHERMVDDIERSTTPTSRRSLSAGRQARH
ncbi:MAG: hypothetical protein CNLJKLNK_01345 [Holosporales bacterium]